MPPRIAVVFGTRPESIKLAPVVTELRRRNVEPTIIATGQHTSLLRGTPAESTMAPQVMLNLPSNNDPLTYRKACDATLRLTWVDDPPAMVVVVGDTASANAGAMAANALGIAVAHVEAGVRTGDSSDPWPEEMFRVGIDRIALQQYCATERNAGNLCVENSVNDRLDAPMPRVTGNPGIDALYSHTRPSKEVQDRVLITLHRRESFGEPLLRIVRGIWEAAHRHPKIGFLWPTHPNPHVQEATGAMHHANNICRVAPMDVENFAAKLSRARAVITDSGGVQEEACALGIPCIVGRDKTDRPESVEIGLAKVVGRTEQGILDGLDWALGFSTRPDPSTCFGDGHASPRIVSHLLENV